MASKTSIVNRALMRIGVSQYVADVETEQSTEAISARLVFDDIRDECLRDFAWPFASSYVSLGLVAGSTAAPYNDEWTFAYRYPADCLHARYLVTGNGRTESDPPPFEIGQDAEGRLIYTDEAFAILKYTVRVIDEGRFDPAFVSMFAWKLGAALAPALTRMDKVADTCIRMYVAERTIAQARAANEGQRTPDPDADAIRARA